jgi:hypothetical protein
VTSDPARDAAALDIRFGMFGKQRRISQISVAAGVGRVLNRRIRVDRFAAQERVTHHPDGYRRSGRGLEGYLLMPLQHCRCNIVEGRRPQGRVKQALTGTFGVPALAVFVLDKRKKPVMPGTPRRARQLRERGRAVVHKGCPFTIRIKNITGGGILAGYGLRQCLLERDGGQRSCCGDKAVPVTKDHVIPRARRGFGAEFQVRSPC